MSNTDTTLQPTSQRPDADGFRRYRIVPSGIGSASKSISTEYGSDDQLPYHVRKAIMSNFIRFIYSGHYFFFTPYAATEFKALSFTHQKGALFDA